MAVVRSCRPTCKSIRVHGMQEQSTIQVIDWPHSHSALYLHAYLLTDYTGAFVFLVAHVVRPILDENVRWNTFWHWCNIQTDVRNIGLCNILFQYVANLTACLISVTYSFNIAEILQRQDIVPTLKEISLTNLGTILGHHINWLNIWNTPLSDIGMMSEYNRYILANICALFYIGSILVQYCTDMAVLLGLQSSSPIKCSSHTSLTYLLRYIQEQVDVM